MHVADPIGEIIDLGEEGWGIQLNAVYGSKEEAEEVLANLAAEWWGLSEQNGLRIIVSSCLAPALGPELVIGASDHGPILRRIHRMKNHRGHVLLSDYGVEDVPVYILDSFEASRFGGVIRVWRVDS